MRLEMKISDSSDRAVSSRRGFLRQTLGATAATVAAAKAATGADLQQAKAPGNDAFGDTPEALTPAGTDFELGHDRSVYAYTAKDGDLAREGFAGKRWGMLIDLRKCIGCQACTAACKFENNIPVGVFRTWVPDVELGTFPDTKRAFLPRLCNHCERPSCIEVCPTGATWQRKDGIVEIDYDLCWGCGACVNACPYDARFINPITKTADKCTFCSQRVDQGLLPACVETCVGSARQFGDLNDRNDPVTRQILGGVVQQLKPGTGNEPRVFYIGLTTELQNNPPGIPTLWSKEQQDMDRNDHDWDIATGQEADHV
jgi:tetrathionate reductase subunit B